MTRANVAFLYLMTGIVALTTLWTVPSAAGPDACAVIFGLRTAQPVPKVQITDEKYQKTTLNLRSTLTGKLATVWRSEWKSKLGILKSNRYVFEMVQGFLSPHTAELVLHGLNPDQEEFVRTVHERLFLLQQSGRLNSEDQLLVRDPPPPAGAVDRTFTYYTKPIVSPAGGKHQIRIRTYVREVVTQKMILGQPVSGYDVTGNQISIEKIGHDLFLVRDNKQSSSNESQLSGLELRSEFGSPIFLFAPHGRKLKMEVKTALEDEISGSQYPLLGGPHMVQKLDVGLSMAQVAWLFRATDSPSDSASRHDNSVDRLENLRESLVQESPDAKARIEAVFDVLAQGVREDPEFLKIQGATTYHRTAFESKSGFQTTIDREQGSYVGDMYNSRVLKNPVQMMRQNQHVMTEDADARHVEFKLPVPAVVSLLGVQFHTEPPSFEAPAETQNRSNRTALDIFYQFVSSHAHPGKFNYLLKKWLSWAE